MKLLSLVVAVAVALAVLLAVTVTGTDAMGMMGKPSEACCKAAANSDHAAACFGTSSSDELVKFWADVGKVCRRAAPMMGNNMRKARVLCGKLKKANCIS